MNNNIWDGYSPLPDNVSLDYVFGAKSQVNRVKDTSKQPIPKRRKSSSIIRVFVDPTTINREIAAWHQQPLFV